ncbi:chorismate mutase [Mycobacterium basiliense]|uniref:chorismate mutase n=1 Tax=Mycobacterium basiliense TaxID=2094119 RepID=UPI0039EFD7A7
MVAALMGASVPAWADGPSALVELVDAAAQRLAVAEPVAAFKWSAHLPVEDPARVQQQLAELADAAIREAGPDPIDPDYVTRVFGDQISATEAIEYSRFAEWKLNPADAPSPPSDLSAARSEIDSLNVKIFSQIVLNWSLLHAPECARELANASSATIRARRFDSLYQKALASATQSYCHARPPT